MLEFCVTRQTPKATQSFCTKAIDKAMSYGCDLEHTELYLISATQFVFFLDFRHSDDQPAGILNDC